MATNVGRYEILSELGRGGMAAVYHARDPRFKREVAVKLLPRDLVTDPQFRARFEREAEIIASLEHPAIVPVYDFGEEDGQPYLVMRYMPGGSLADQLRGGEFSLGHTLTILRPLCSALDYAHSHGVIHRDLKPGNILSDQINNPYLSDFGIAKLTEATTVLTGGAIGTPAYMSPEQIHGDLVIDGRSDLYSLGVILFQMLSAQLPFQADTPPKLMMKHLLDPIPSILSFRPDLPPSVDAVILKAMAKDREDRFASAAEMLSALEDASRDPVIPSILPSSTRREVPAEQVTSVSHANPPMVEERGKRAGKKAKRQTGREPRAGTPLRVLLWIGLLGVLIAAIVFGLRMFPDLRFGPSTADLNQQATETALTVVVPTLTIEERAMEGVNTNAEWTPYTRVINGVEMALVPAGCFPMGSEDGDSADSPVHNVCEKQYWIDVNEVTNKQSGQAAPNCLDWSAADDQPRVCISWAEASDHCVSRGARLPTEAEWEFAARGPDALVYPWGNEFIPFDVVYSDNSNGRPAQIGSRQGGVSWVGALDLSGNVEEWVNDWVDAGYYGLLTDLVLHPEGPESGTERVVRGGSWGDGPLKLRSALRDSSDPSHGYLSVGFRCAMSYQP